MVVILGFFLIGFFFFVGVIVLGLFVWMVVGDWRLFIGLILLDVFVSFFNY